MFFSENSRWIVGISPERGLAVSSDSVTAFPLCQRDFYSDYGIPPRPKAGKGSKTGYLFG